MHTLILLVSMLGGGPAENSWLSPVFERGSDIWSDRESAWQSLTAALEGLVGGGGELRCEVCLFDEDVALGTTLNLPTFNFTTVTSAVEVPDGGKMLLEGIKRLKEGHNEPAVPILSKIPYAKHSSPRQEAQSLMLMVTPRIITIQAEEEEKLGLAIPEEPAANSPLTP